MYQRIDAETGQLDNIVELLFTLPGLPFPLTLFVGQQQQEQQERARQQRVGRMDSPAARLTLRHDFEVLGGNTVQVRPRLPFPSFFLCVLGWKAKAAAQSGYD